MILQMAQEDDGLKVELCAQPFASPEKLGDVISLTYKNLKQKKPTIQRAMALYLANKDTEYILFKPIKVYTSEVIGCVIYTFSGLI